MVCPEWNQVNKDDYRGIWVYVEHFNGKISEGSLQLIGKAKELAAKLGVDVTAIMVGKDLDKLLMEPIYYGADKVIYVDDDRLSVYLPPHLYAASVVELANKYKPEIILFAATKRGRELLPTSPIH